MMRSAIFHDIVTCREQFSNWEEVVDYIGAIFVGKGYASQEYFDYVKKDLRESEAYMVIVPHFALLHSTPEHGAFKDVFHFMKLEYPVEFHHECNDPVRYVITFTSTDADSHIEGIQKLASILMNDEFMKALEDADSEEKLVDCIRTYEK